MNQTHFYHLINNSEIYYNIIFIFLKFNQIFKIIHVKYKYKYGYIGFLP